MLTFYLVLWETLPRDKNPRSLVHFINHYSSSFHKIWSFGKISLRLRSIIFSPPNNLVRYLLKSFGPTGFVNASANNSFVVTHAKITFLCWYNNLQYQCLGFICRKLLVIHADLIANIAGLLSTSMILASNSSKYTYSRMFRIHSMVQQA